jgi:molecular chaperone GrpE
VTSKQPEGEPAAAPPEAGSFGDAAGEMADETEVDEVTAGKRRRVTELDDISGIDNMLEEGAPLEPEDVADEPVDRVAPVASV